MGPRINKSATAMEIGVPVWGINRMKIKGDTCNFEARRIWLNLALIKQPPKCREYIVVYDLADFLERSHCELSVFSHGRGDA
jgi:predicted metal-dependent hydrolase